MKKAITPERWAQIEEIYQQAQEHAADSRARFLNAASGGDEELRREVESLLRADHEAEEFLETPAMNLAAQMIAKEQVPRLVGKKISHYEIIAQIGAGGMGEVYRARDTRLGRDVAIKVLPAHFARDDELRRRFEREARAISSLSHPHICAIHDIGHEDGISFLVLEYVEGETLTARLARGAMPMDQVLRHTIEIADALDHAHRHAIVHRDLKPGNIILTKNGAKLLDFGLAKFQPPGARGTVLVPSSLTESAQLTGRGRIIGTLQYMAPEQLEGKQTDARTDIFALGAVLYEMASGRKAFEGESQASLIAAILRVEPRPMSELQPVVSPALERVAKTCLAKDPEERWQTAHDLVLELKWIAEGGSLSRKVATVATKRGLRRERLLWIAALFVTAIVVGVTAWLSSRTPAPAARPLVRFSLEIPSNLQLAKDPWPVIAISPDGTALVYVLSNGASRQLYIRRLDQLEAAPIAGTEGAHSPFFSPDGQWIGFYANGRLRKVSLLGGVALVICTVPPVMHGASWGPDDTIFFSPSHSQGVFKVSSSGGEAQAVTTPDDSKGERGHYWPQILPGGKAILFTIGISDSFDDARIAVQLLDTRERKVIIDGGTCGRYLPTGHLVYARAGALLAVPFDLSRLEVKGAPVRVVEGIKVDSRSGAASFSFSNDGSLAYVSGKSDADARELLWVDRRGEARPIMDAKHDLHTPSLSPDGERLAICIVGAAQNIWVYDIARGTLTRLSFEEDWGPIWVPDGTRITYTSTRLRRYPGIAWRSADGSGEAQQLVAGEGPIMTGSWSPDGKVLAYTDGFAEEGGRRRPTGYDIWLLRVDGERKPEPFLCTQFDESAPDFSPDGRWLAYVSNESGRNEVYVTAFPTPSAKRQISTEGGTSPRWARNGKELFYRSGKKMMAVAISLQPEFNTSTPRVLFEGGYEEFGRPDMPRNYDVTPDGQQFVMLKSYEGPSVLSQVIVALEWFDDLGRRVPAKGHRSS